MSRFTFKLVPQGSCLHVAYSMCALCSFCSAVVSVKAKSDSSLRIPPSHQHHSGWIQTSLPATTVFTQLRDIAFTGTLVSQMQSVVRKSYLSRVYEKFSCGTSDRELTFYFNCGVCIWRHVKRVDAHVFPGVIRPGFIDSVKKNNKKKYSCISSTLTYWSVDL